MTELFEQFLEDHVDGYGVSDYSAAVDALVAAGLLTEDRAKEWRTEHARIRALGPGHLGPYDAAVEAKAVELLEALFEPVRPRDSHDWDGASFQRYQEALSTLTAIGALSYAHARPWLQRQSDALVPGGWQPPPPEPEMPFTAGGLSAVLAGPPTRLHGRRVKSLELFNDCVILRYHQLLPPEPEDPVERRQLLSTPSELEDDRGTHYEPAHIPCAHGCKHPQIQGWPEVLVGWQAFVPAAPLDARVFTVTWRGAQFEISLNSPTITRAARIDQALQRTTDDLSDTLTLVIKSTPQASAPGCARAVRHVSSGASREHPRVMAHASAATPTPIAAPGLWHCPPRPCV
jgi:hypothetical protein